MLCSCLSQINLKTTMTDRKRRTAIATALVAALKEKNNDKEGVSFEEVYVKLDNNFKRKLPKIAVKSHLTNNSLDAGKTIVLPNGNFQFIASESVDAAVPEIAEPPAAPEIEEPPVAPEFEEPSAASEIAEALPAPSDADSEEKLPLPPAVIKTPAKRMKRLQPKQVRERSERKRVQKVVFDPSNSGPAKKKKIILPKSKSEFILSAETEKPKSVVPEATCVVCSGSVGDSSEGEPMFCEECNCIAHRKCTNAGDIRQLSWRCEDCKFCTLCRGKKVMKGDPMVNCGVCSESYHIKCANVKKYKPAMHWLCSTCKRIFPTDSDGNGDSDSSSSVTALSPRVSPEPKPKPVTRKQSKDVLKKDSKKEVSEEMGEIPDCSDWSPEQVHTYFSQFVPSNDAQVFLDQEIDGRILLLLNRTDVLTRFNLKLGPAIKMYSFVKRLQERSPNISLCWT